MRINVQGAFIVDEEQPGTPQSEDYEHDPKDIRLPNHTAVVSHIALDVSVEIVVVCSYLSCSDHKTPFTLSPARTKKADELHYRSEGHSQNSYTSRANPVMMQLVAG